MELKFNDLKELDQFMQYCVHLGRQFLTSAPPMDLPEASEPVNAGASEDNMDHDAPYDVNGTSHNELPAEAIVPTDKPKRTRRTKAETEAERAGNVQTPAAAAEAARPDTSATTTAAAVESAPIQGGAETRGNPFAQSPSTQAILDAPNQSAATLAGMAAMRSSSDEVPAERNADPIVNESMPSAPATRAERAAALLADGALTDSLAHLKHCQKFIQVHGMSVYEKSFVDGLTPNIAVYTAEQCALHVAVMEELA